MKVLHIEYGLGFGGSAISLAELVRGLREATPVESTVLTFQARGINEDAYPGATVIRKPRLMSYQTRTDLIDLLRRKPIPPLLADLAIKAYNVAYWAYESHLTRFIARIVRTQGIDVVHANNFWEWSAIRGAQRGGARCILHFRGFANPAPTTVRERAGDAVDRIITRYIAISDSVAAATRAYGAPADKVVTIPNPVSVDTYVAATARRETVRAKHGFGPAHLVVGVFGRVTAWKGQVEFLDAMRTIVGECADLRVLIVGDESDAADVEYRDRMVALAATPELAGHVTLAGFQADVAAYYAACDIIVHCSRTPEPFGRVVIEAMATSKPLIAMDEGGPSEIITDGVDGILVPPRDEARLAAAVRTLYHDPAKRECIGRAAFETVRTRYDSAEIARRVYAEYLVPVR